MSTYAHIKRCLELSDRDIASAVAERGTTKALLDQLAKVSRPGDGAPKLLLVFAKIASSEVDWIDGALRDRDGRRRRRYRRRGAERARSRDARAGLPVVQDGRAARGVRARGRARAAYGRSARDLRRPRTGGSFLRPAPRRKRQEIPPPLPRSPSATSRSTPARAGARRRRPGLAPTRGRRLPRSFVPFAEPRRRISKR